MAGRGSAPSRADVKPLVHLLGLRVALCSLLLASCASSESPEKAPAARQRRSDDYDNLDNFLMGSSDYDNFFLKTAKSVPRIGRRSSGDTEEQEEDTSALHVGRRSSDANELVPSYAHGYDHFFLKASKSVPRIGKRNDEFFMKTAKSVPRIGRRSGDGPDNFLLKGKEHSDFLKTAEPRHRRSDFMDTLALQAHQRDHQLERRSRAQVEESTWPSAGSPGGNDAVLGGQHRIQRRNYDELMAKAAKTVPRMGKRRHATLDEVGDWGTEQQWPWFRQQDPSPGPYKRANPADLIDLRDVPWAELDILLRRLEASRHHSDGHPEDDRGHDVVLLEAEGVDDKQPDAADKWVYNLPEKKDDSKERDEPRFQPDVNK